MSKRTLALIIVLVFITAILIVVAVSPKQSSPLSTLPAAPTPTPAAQSILSMSPNPLVVSTSTGVVDVMLESDSNKVTAVQLELSFDPKKITKVTITPGTALENPVVLLNSVDLKEGRISYAIGISPTGEAQAVNGIVATLAVQTTLAPLETTEIKFLPKSLVTAEGITASVLKSATDLTITYSPSQQIQPTQAR